MPTPPEQFQQRVQDFIDGLRNNPEYDRNPEKRAVIDDMARELERVGTDTDAILRILTSVRERLEALNQEGGGKPDAKAGANPPGNPPGGPPNDPNENIDILSSLGSRYAECLQTLGYYHIPKKIKGIDKKKYDVPTLDQIKQKLSSQPKKLALIQKLRSPKMLLRPIALSTKTLSDALDNEKKNPQKKVNPYNGVNIWDETLEDKEGNIVYNSTKYQTPITQPDGTSVRQDGGKTKLELLQNNQTSFPGWDVVFIDGETEVPQHTTSKNAHTLLKKFTKAGYCGMTVEDALLLQMDGIKKGIPYSQQKWEFLLGNYLPPGSGFVPDSNWDPTVSRVFVDVYDPDHSAPDLGARRLVRI